MMLPQKQILVVEDNALNREMLVEILADQYQVLEAENGQEALDVLARNKSNVALILLDITMPVMDGYTFLDRIKADPELALIPVIVTTRNNKESDEVTALIHGATDFVPKPYHPQIILHRVASIINLRETAAIVNQLQYDRLTGLYSKEFFYQRAQELLVQHPEREYNIICSNIENFKLYNDVFGVPEGDRLLREIAVWLREQMGEGELCGRYGADRFVCLRERGRESESRKQLELEQQSSRISHVKKVVIKWGVYEIADRAIPVEHMCDRASLAVDSIKGRYKRYFAVYDDALRSKLLREQIITDTMEYALEEGQFSVYFQPKYSVSDGRLAGAEALARWKHPELGFISPGEFIPLFEKNGFITRLDRYVWDRTCAMMGEWKEKGYHICPVSVNVSRADVYQTDLVDILLGTVRKYGILPAELHLEITESAYAEDPDQIISTVDKLRKMGFVIEMDDFGSGYSSLNMLNQMDLDILKLDMKFIQSETAKPVGQGILRFVVGLAHWMHLNVVAEGVETREQLERLREIGCDYIQGYLCAKPMPGNEFEALLKDCPPQETSAPGTVVRKKTEQNSLLVVDENASYRELVRRTLQDEYRVLEAADAHSALACIQGGGPDVVSTVILSMSLPEQGADFFLKALRQDPMLWRVPVLATIPQDCKMEELVQDLDTDDFLCKRHPQCDLRKRVKRLAGLAACQERERHWQDEACHDYMTGLLNRRGLQYAIEALRQGDMPLAVYVFDVDDLKKVNDGCGHSAGDRLLKSFSELLRDSTGEGDILARYGGDEFVAILRHVASREEALQKGEEICRELNRCRLQEGSSAACSAGITLCGMDEKPSEQLIERADQALYRAKQENKGGCCLWERPVD